MDDDQEECFRLSEELAANYRGVDIYIRSGKSLDQYCFSCLKHERVRESMQIPDSLQAFSLSAVQKKQNTMQHSPEGPTTQVGSKITLPQVLYGALNFLR